MAVKAKDTDERAAGDPFASVRTQLLSSVAAVGAAGADDRHVNGAPRVQVRRAIGDDLKGAT